MRWQEKNVSDVFLCNNTIQMGVSDAFIFCEIEVKLGNIGRSCIAVVFLEFFFKENERCNELYRNKKTTKGEKFNQKPIRDGNAQKKKKQRDEIVYNNYCDDCCF